MGMMRVLCKWKPWFLVLEWSSTHAFGLVDSLIRLVCLVDLSWNRWSLIALELGMSVQFGGWYLVPRLLVLRRGIFAALSPRLEEVGSDASAAAWAAEGHAKVAQEWNILSQKSFTEWWQGDSGIMVCSSYAMRSLSFVVRKYSLLWSLRSEWLSLSTD